MHEYDVSINFVKDISTNYIKVLLIGPATNMTEGLEIVVQITKMLHACMYTLNLL